jgi:hypothetical protein
MIIRYMAEKRRKLNVQYNEDSSNKLLRYVKCVFLDVLCFSCGFSGAYKRYVDLVCICVSCKCMYIGTKSYDRRWRNI